MAGYVWTDPIVEQSGAHSHDNASRLVATSVAHSAQQIGEDLAAQSKPDRSSGVPTLLSVPEDDGGTTAAQQDSNPPKRVHDDSNLESGMFLDSPGTFCQLSPFYQSLNTKAVMWLPHTIDVCTNEPPQEVLLC